MQVIHAKPQPESNHYDIYTNCKVFSDLPMWLQKQKLGNKYAIITDKNLVKYGKKLEQGFKKLQQTVHVFSVKAGERSKSYQQTVTLCEDLLRKKFDRKTVIIALGGGVIGDLAGFVARIFLRGVPYIQVPTSLLAMVDSSIGGKVGVDSPSGKNLIGAFYPPKAVFIDLDFLKLLPAKELRMGLAEVVKYGVIYDRSFFEFLEKNVTGILKKKPELLEKVITRSAAIKVEVVDQDEKEANLRMILNYGHTLGHALEHASKFRLAHGEAISIGMNFANQLAQEICSFKESDRVNLLLQAFDLPLFPKKNHFTASPLLSIMRHDKKNIDGNIQFILPEKIGKVGVKKVEIEVLRKHLKRFLEKN